MALATTSTQRSRTRNTKATAADAQLILQLYDLRRESEMRRARHFISAEFWPTSAEDILQILRAFPSRENAWLGQVTSYWEMAAALVLHGALHENLFFDCSGEMYCVFAKFKPYLEELRKKTPKILVNVEQVIMRAPAGRERMQRLERRLARREQRMSEKNTAISTAATGDI